MNYSRSALITLAAALFFAVLTPLYAEKRPPMDMNGRGRGMRGNAVFWRVFSELSDAERKKMQELQRNNPEEFAAEMRKRVEAHEKKIQAKIEHLSALIGKYRKSTDEKERAKLKDELIKLEKEQFEQRLAGMARTIANTKQRVALMEKELEKRNAKKDAIVEARVDALLSGELPVPVSPRLRRGGPPHPGNRGNMPPGRFRGGPPMAPRHPGMGK